MALRQGWELVKTTFSEWDEDNVSRLAAALAYYTAFSLAPLLVITIGIAGLAFGDDAAQGEIVGQLEGLVGTEGAKLIEQMVAASRKTSEGITATLIGFAVLLFGATGVFGQLQSALDDIWDVKPRPGRGWRGVMRDRFFSFTMVLGTGFLLLVSLALSAAFAAVGGYLSGLLHIPEFALQSFQVVFSLAMVTLLFALIFKVVPDAKVAWRDVWVGALITALLFTLGKYVIGLYLGKSSVASTFGAAASLAILLIWLYYSAQILLLGAEFTQVYATRFGSRIRPGRGAIPADEDPPDDDGAREDGKPSERQDGKPPARDDGKPRERPSAATGR